jgi:DNA repair exonuclease SbcCD ATPase subunit/DNA repair exonuclease SbcCD nuclease subunit
MLIAHIADIHWRGLTRHKEYKNVFIEFFSQCREKNVDTIIIAGDIWHTKTQGISPEAIDMLSWFFSEAASVCPVHIILGNHDMNCSNLSRQDAISPIIKSLNNDNLFLYKESGVYPIDSNDDQTYNLCVFSCWDEKTDAWENVKPIKDNVNIALYHGCVWGAETDDGWQLNGETTVDFFKDFDFTFLGDIHKHQFLTEDKRIAYPGSTIPQNFGEHGPKGYLLWDIKNRDEFDVKFCELKESYPFITLDWQGDVRKTIEKALMFKDGTRFRISSSVYLNQVDIKQLVNELKIKKQADQVVFKIDKEFNVRKIKTNSDNICNDLHDIQVHMKLLKKLYADRDISDDVWKDVYEKLGNYLSDVTKDDISRNIKWQIKKMEFDNMFVYGKGNVIDFQKLNGITGIFAPNRSGKSSIIGTIAYGLFNSTDRGKIKNLHVINSRKGYCRSKVLIGANNKNFIVDRSSTRHTNKKTGAEHAVTSLNFVECDEQGNTIKNLNGLQRSDTDKQIKKLIGTFDDFLITSLSTQFSTNKLITEGSTYRNATLARFLGLDIFEKLLEKVKSDSDDLKVELKRFADRDWDLQVKELNDIAKELEQSVKQHKDDLVQLRLERDELKLKLSELQSVEFTTQDELKSQEDIILALKQAEKNQLKKIRTANDELSDINKQIKKLLTKKEKIDVSVITDNIERKKNIEKMMSQLKNEYKHENSTLNVHKKSIKLLDEVPCGSQFPMCKFIKDSHESKKKIKKQQKLVDEVLEQLDKTTRDFHEAIEKKFELQLDEYKQLDKDISALKINFSKKEVEIERLENALELVNNDILKENIKLRDMKRKKVNTAHANKLVDTKRKIRAVEGKIESFDTTYSQSNAKLALTKDKIETLLDEKVLYQEKRSQWNAYELLLSAFSKKGIPAQIILEQLPVINAEIASLLHGICDFTLVLESDSAATNMDIYIDYGDSRRLIELGSGMEKIISSLAIRVALNNISSLPKNNTLIIDEGFGSLDETQLETCTRFLTSLKKRFKNIIVISHIEAVKDMVDNLLEITKDKKKNSHVYYE